MMPKKSSALVASRTTDRLTSNRSAISCSVSSGSPGLSPWSMMYLRSCAVSSSLMRQRRILGPFSCSIAAAFAFSLAGLLTAANDHIIIQTKDAHKGPMRK